MRRSERGGPERVGDYLLQQTLGNGSFGVVVLGVHRSTQARVAIKVMVRDADNESAIRRIAAEIATMEKIGRGCPFVVRLIEVLLGRHHIYLAMEYASGGELFRAMFKPASDPDAAVGSTERTARARRYFQELVMGVQWCHSQGVAHRDLKPQNLLLGINGILKIADFGLAASFNPSIRSSSLGLRRTMCGSPMYMAPELLSLRDGHSYNALATDAWSCGAVLYAMLCGTPPFPATNYEQLVKLASRPRTSLKLPEHHLSPGARLLLRGMLRVDPRRRYSLPRAASTPWFQDGLRQTLERTPNFRLPDCLWRAVEGSSRRGKGRRAVPCRERGSDDDADPSRAWSASRRPSMSAPS